MVLSIQEMVAKTEEQRKDIKHTLDAGFFDYSEVNLFGKGASNLQEAKSLNADDTNQILESLRKIPQ